VEVGGAVNSRIALGDFIPWPFVGVTVLLVVFIIVTPVLLSIGSGPGITTNAELIVDRLPGASGTNLYVRATGTADRYAYIHVGLADGFAWDGIHAVPWSRLAWTQWSNQSETLGIEVSTIDDPVAVNISALYVSAGGSALYVGILAFYVGGTPASGEVLYVATLTSGVSVPPNPTTVSNSSFPLPIGLAASGSGGV
jgi:hypothetical protein